MSEAEITMLKRQIGLPVIGELLCHVQMFALSSFSSTVFFTSEAIVKIFPFWTTWLKQFLQRTKAL